MSTGNQEYIRDMNRACSRGNRNHPPLSRADLAKMLHLTKATVSTIVQELLDRQLVIELGSAEKTSMGRKPICLLLIIAAVHHRRRSRRKKDHHSHRRSEGKIMYCKRYPIDPSLSLEEYLISLLHKTKSDLPKTPCGSSESPSESTASSATTSFYSHPTTI